MTDGGPACASESTFGLKYVINMILLPYHLVIISKVFYDLKINYSSRIKNTKNIHASNLEYALGALCFLFEVIQVSFKIQTKTLIFLLNPCHITTLVQGFLFILSNSIWTEFLMVFQVGSAFGAMIGIVFAENGELS